MVEREKRTWCEISLANIRHNCLAIRSALPEGCRFLGVVKANAYGHGAVAVAHTLAAAGADYLAVACLDEAEELRLAGITLPILILGHTPPAYTNVLLQYAVTQSVSSLETARAYSDEAARLGGTLKLHVALDTGMSRLGFACDTAAFDASLDAVEALCRLPGLDAEGVFTHFAVSDEPGEDCEAYTREQFRRFTAMLDALHARGVTFRLRHCANTGAVLRYPETALDMARPGLLLYGYGDAEGRLGLRPCMRLVTRVAAVKHYAPGTSVSYGRRWKAERPTRMGVIGAGYADGLLRLLSNRCAFATKAGPAPQRGSICMDMCMIDLTELPTVGVGDEVEIFGAESSLDALAAAAQTIPYELLCAVSKRVPRIYKDF